MAEVFSMPRVCKAAEAAGLSCGGSYDILNGWDLQNEGKKKKTSGSSASHLTASPPDLSSFSMGSVEQHERFEGIVEETKGRTCVAQIFYEFDRSLTGASSKQEELTARGTRDSRPT